MKKETGPSVLVVSGNETFLRQRFLFSFLDKYRLKGWQVVYIQGDNLHALQGATCQNPFLPVEGTLVVVENPEKTNLDFLKTYLQVEDPTTVFVLHVEGNVDGTTKFGKFVKSSLDKRHMNFPAPTPWKAQEVAVEFVKEEVRALGMSMDSKVINALCSKVGSNPGTLHFEISKMATLARAEESSVIDASHVRRMMAPITKTDVMPLTEALARKNTASVIRLLDQIFKTSKDDPTIWTCRTTGATAIKWMQAAHLPVESVANGGTMLAMNPWMFTNSILPAARAWGAQGTRDLVRCFARAEKAVFVGSIAPWTVLTAGLLSLLPATSTPNS